jgi:glycerol uptake facilitator-like aquaporin
MSSPSLPSAPPATDPPRRRGHDRPLPDRCRPAGERSAGYLWFAEGVATLGLLLAIFGVVRSGRSAVAAFAVAAFAVAGYIAGAYWFTSSTSFANPAVTIGRAFSDTFAGIEPASVPMFIVAQLVGPGPPRDWSL